MIDVRLIYFGKIHRNFRILSPAVAGKFSLFTSLLHLHIFDASSKIFGLQMAGRHILIDMSFIGLPAIYDKLVQFVCHRSKIFVRY